MDTGRSRQLELARLPFRVSVDPPLHMPAFWNHRNDAERAASVFTKDNIIPRVLRFRINPTKPGKHSPVNVIRIQIYPEIREFGDRELWKPYRYLFFLGLKDTLCRPCSYFSFFFVFTFYHKRHRRIYSTYSLMRSIRIQNQEIRICGV